MKKTVAIIVGAGAGVRMGTNRAKQFLEVDGQPILALTLKKFQSCSAVDSIILVVPVTDLEFCQKGIVDKYDLSKVGMIVPGGRKRQDSVRHGIEASDGKYELVLIHDGVRPLVDSLLIEQTIAAATEYRAVITGLPAKDTVKEVDENSLVKKTYDRKKVWLVQTPQAFSYEDIHAAHKQAHAEAWDGVTDDAMLIEKAGIPVKVIPGSEKNIKITTPADLELVRFYMGKKE
jgi:2-C-methyl-D-erythritol 4-phosphate cytidylyltransferase